MGPFLVVEQESQMMGSDQDPSLQYFLASLAGIARALEDFGYRDEAGQLFLVKERLETKIVVPEGDISVRGVAGIQK